jgi:hypothetical protein
MVGITRQNRLTPIQVIAGAVVLATAALILFINGPWGDTKPVSPLSGKTTVTAAQEAGAKVIPTVTEPSLSAKPPGPANPSQAPQ